MDFENLVKRKSDLEAKRAEFRADLKRAEETLHTMELALEEMGFDPLLGVEEQLWTLEDEYRNLRVMFEELYKVVEDKLNAQLAAANDSKA